MVLEGWIEPTTHIAATGQVVARKITNATIDDRNGKTIDRKRSFDSKQDFFTWARQRTTYCSRLSV